MSALLPKVLADGSVDRTELDAIFARYDRDQNGHLDPQELRALATTLSGLISGTTDDILQIMDFYHLEYDANFSRAELKGFLECHVVDSLSAD